MEFPNEPLRRTDPFRSRHRHLGLRNRSPSLDKHRSERLLPAAEAERQLTPAHEHRPPERNTPMTKRFASLVLAASILAGAGAAYAGSPHSHALRDIAQLGTITPGGVFDGR